jgi:phage/plasmid-associated DNA primase
MTLGFDGRLNCLNGKTKNCKSKVIILIKRMMDEYAITMLPSIFTVHIEMGKALPELTWMHGAYVVFMTERSKYIPINPDQFKRWTSEDDNTCRTMSSDKKRSFELFCKLIMATNNMPKFEVNDETNDFEALKETLLIVPFDISFKERSMENIVKNQI